MELEIDISDLKESTVRRLLREAYAKEKNRSLPMHKRKAEPEVEVDDAGEESEEENEKLVGLASEKGSPGEIPMTDEDLSEEAGKDLVNPPKKPAKKTLAGKIGKPYQPS